MGQLDSDTQIQGLVRESPLSKKPGEKPSAWVARVVAAAAQEEQAR